MKHLFLFLAFSLYLLPTSLFSQTSYTWNGGTSTDFATSTNWTPNGVPGSGDNITIVSTSNDPVLDGNRTLNNLTMTSGILKLGGYDLTVDGTADMNGGEVENGLFKMTQGNIDFYGVEMDCVVDIDADVDGVDHSTFREKVDLVSSGAFNAEGNRFEDTTQVTMNGSGYTNFGLNTPDTFLAPVTFNLETTGIFRVVFNANGSLFDDGIILNNNSGSASHGFEFGSSGSPNITVNGDIELNVTTGSGYVNFNLGTTTHNGALTIGSTGYNAGNLTLKGYKQSATTAVDLSAMTGTSALILGPNLTLEGDLTAPTTQNTAISTGCLFKGEVDVPKLSSWGGSTFEKKTDLFFANALNTNNNKFKDTANITVASGGYTNLGLNGPDTFLAPVTFNLEAAGIFRLNFNSAGTLFDDDVVLNNNSGNTSVGFEIGSSGSPTTTINGDVYMNTDSISGYTNFNLGTTTHNGLLKVGSDGYHAGLLTLKGYTQTVAGNIDLSTMDHNASIAVQTGADIMADFAYASAGNATLNGAVFRGNVNIESPYLPVTYCEFLGSARLEKTGTGNNLNGGNKFHGAVTIENSSSTNYLYWGHNVADTLLSNVTLINRSPQPIWMGFSTEVALSGNVRLVGDSAADFRFGNTTAGYKALFNGTLDQRLYVGEDLDAHFYRMETNKPSGKLYVYDDISIEKGMEFTDGIIVCKDSAIVSFLDNVTPTANDTSFVEGTVTKVGNDAFSFPIGRDGLYRPLTISAPSNTSDAFTAAYYVEDTDPDYPHSQKDVSINYLDRTQYWNFDQTAGSTGVYVTLGWVDVDCGIADIADPLICAWDDSNSKWKDLGNSNPTGTTATGSATTTAVSQYYGPYTWGDYSGRFANAGPDRVIEAGDTVTIGVMTQENWEYDWTPSATVTQADTAITRAHPTTKTEYVLEVEGENGCTTTDTVMVHVVVLPNDTVLVSDSHSYVSNAGQLIDSDRLPRPDVLFYNSRENPNLYLRQSGWSMVTASYSEDTSFVSRVDVELVGAHKREGIPLDTIGEVFNYFLPHCPEGITGVRGYNYVVYPEVFDGVDMYFLSNTHWYKMYFVIAPETDPEVISFHYSGIDTLSTTVYDTSLTFTTVSGTVVQPKFDAYEMNSSGSLTNLSWKPNYSISTVGDTVRLTDFGSYDDSDYLVLELDVDIEAVATPNQYNNVWSTYIGTSNGFEAGLDLETNSNGDLFFVGGASTGEFPTTPGVVQDEPGGTGHLGIRDILIVKFSWQGVRQISTYYGGFFDDVGTDIEIDENNSQIVIYGESLSDDYPTTPGAHQPFNANPPLVDKVLTVLSDNMQNRLWSTYLGGTGEDLGHDSGESLAIDDNGDVYVSIESNENPIATQSLTGAYNQGAPVGNSTLDDSYLAHFNGDDGSLLWSTYFPANINSITYDPGEGLYLGGNAYLEPDATTCDPPTTGGFVTCDIGGYFQDYRSFDPNVGNFDGFIAKFNTGNELVWSTYIGGATINDVEVKGRDLYLTGFTLADGDPSTSTYPDCSEPGVGYCLACDGVLSGSDFQLENQGNSDIFIARFFTDNYDVHWATQYGGDGYDNGFDAVVNDLGTLFIDGTSNHSDFPAVDYGNNFYFEGDASDQSGINASEDPVIMMINHHAVEWATFYGGGNEVSSQIGFPAEQPMGITTHGTDRLYVTGVTLSMSFPYRCGEIPNQYCRQPVSSTELQDGFITLFRTDGTNWLGIDEIVTEGLSIDDCLIYPNPTNEYINVSASVEKDDKLEIFVHDLMGRCVYSRSRLERKQQFDTKIDVREFSKGTYSVLIRTSSGNQWSCRFVKI